MKGSYRFIPRFFFNWFLFSCSFFCILLFRHFHQILVSYVEISGTKAMQVCKILSVIFYIFCKTLYERKFLCCIIVIHHFFHNTYLLFKICCFLCYNHMLSLKKSSF